MKVLISCAAMAATVSLSSAAGAQQVLKTEPWRRGVAVRVEVAGKERLFTLDTAGGVSFISPALAKELNCERGARVVGFRMTGDKLDTPRCDNVAIRISGHPFTIPVAGVYDVGELAAKDAAHSVDGMLALDVFAGKTVTFDFAGEKIIVETESSARKRVAHARELPARIARELSGRAISMFIDVQSAMGTLEFEVDSGNGGTILVGKPYSRALGIDPDKGPQQGRIQVAPGIAAEGVIFPAGITLDGNLGMPFLKAYLVTMDLERGRLWLTPNPTPPPSGMGVPPVLPKG